MSTMSTSVCDALAEALGSVEQVFAEQERRAKAEFDEERQRFDEERHRFDEERHRFDAERQTLKAEIAKLKAEASCAPRASAGARVGVQKSVGNRSPGNSPKKGNHEYECVITNSPETAKGLDYKYSLGPEDDGEVLLMDSGINHGAGEGGKDLKKQAYWTIKRQNPFFSDRGWGCECGITWGRASGSNVLRNAGLTGTFQMGCDKVKIGDSKFCSSHQNGQSIYETKYNRPINGSYLTHYEFLIELQKGGANIA